MRYPVHRPLRAGHRARPAPGRWPARAAAVLGVLFGLLLLYGTPSACCPALRGPVTLTAHAQVAQGHCTPAVAGHPASAGMPCTSHRTALPGEFPESAAGFTTAPQASVPQTTTPAGTTPGRALPRGPDRPPGKAGLPLPLFLGVSRT